VDVDDRGARVVAVVRRLDDLVGLLGEIGVLGFALEVARLGNGDDDFSLAGHIQDPFSTFFVSLAAA
jgi:hypothetical protein